MGSRGILTSSLYFIWNLLFFLIAYIDSPLSNLSPYPYSTKETCFANCPISARGVRPSTNNYSIALTYSVTIQQKKWFECSDPCRQRTWADTKAWMKLRRRRAPSYGRVHTSSKSIWLFTQTKHVDVQNCTHNDYILVVVYLVSHSAWQSAVTSDYTLFTLLPFLPVIHPTFQIS